MITRVGAEGDHSRLAKDAPLVTGAIVAWSGGSDVDTWDKGRRDVDGQRNCVLSCLGGRRFASSEYMVHVLRNTGDMVSNISVGRRVGRVASQ